MARLLIILGLLLLAAGVLLAVFPRALSWFGNLPGDINIRRENTRVFIPITSMLVASAVLTVVLNAVAWLVRRFG